MINKIENEYYEKGYCDNFDAIINSIQKEQIINVYVDGSFDDKKNIFSYAFSVYKKDTLIYTETGVSNGKRVSDYKSVGAELYGAMRAFEFLNKYNLRTANLYYDYTGIRDFILNRNKKIPFAAYYYDFFIECNLNINFYKIQAHKSNKNHNEVDKMSRNSLHKNLF